MLAIFERELVWKYNYAKRIYNRFICRQSSFPRSEHSAINLSGKWDETIYGTSDVNQY